MICILKLQFFRTTPAVGVSGVGSFQEVKFRVEVRFTAHIDVPHLIWTISGLYAVRVCGDLAVLMAHLS